MNTVFIRAKGYGLTTIRAIMEQMETPVTQVVTGSDVPEDAMQVRWGTVPNMPNKYEARMRMADCMVSIPETSLYPIRFPQIFRFFNHHAGLHFHYLPGDGDDDDSIFESGYYSEFISKSLEYRVFVVNGFVACVCRKIPNNPSDVIWNGDNTSMVNVKWGDWPLEVCRQAINACTALNVKFGAVDVVVDGDNKAYVLEVNTAPGIESPYRIKCLAKAFDTYQNLNDSTMMFLTNPLSSWKDIIHPGVWDAS